MTRACGCSGDGCCESDVEVVQRSRGESKRPAERSRCAGGKFAKFSGDESRGDARRPEVEELKLPRGCRSKGGCCHEGKLPSGCRSKGDCLREEVEKRELPCGCRSEGDCFHEELKKAKRLTCKEEEDCFHEGVKKAKKLACGSKDEGDCLVDDERKKKLACGCNAEGDCLHEESKKVKFDRGCKSEGDCFQEEVKKSPEKDSCGCNTGEPCSHKMSGERKYKTPCCHNKKPGTLACGCKSEGDCYHEVSKQDPCSLACGRKSEGDCFHEVIKQLPRRLECGCQSEGGCLHDAIRKSKMRADGEVDEKIKQRLELSGPRTDEIYRTFNIPTRFMYPKLLKGYRDKAGSPPHPCYRATSTDYGWFSPTVHTVPTAYFPRDYAFSLERSRGGMYRNCSLNTELDKHLP